MCDVTNELDKCLVRNEALHIFHFTNNPVSHSIFNIFTQLPVTDATRSNTANSLIIYHLLATLATLPSNPTKSSQARHLSV
jgi:hypothetical protein